MALDGEQKVIDFMDEVRKAKDMEREDDAFRNSDHYKLHLIAKSKDAMRNHCCDSICKTMYRDSIPLGDTYKQAHLADLDDSFDQFIKSRCPQGLLFYVREGLRKGSPFAKQLLECVDRLVAETYDGKEMNVEDEKPEDLEFDPKQDIENEKIEIISQDLSAPEISQKLYDMTKRTAVNEIERAKKSKEHLKQLQDELSNDINMHSRAAVESALELRGVTDKKYYEPTLFEGINIGKLNTVLPRFESGELENYDLMDALTPIKEAMTEGEDVTENTSEPHFATPDELALVESVIEYSGLGLIKALRLESFGKNDVIRMADRYAQTR